ncbi:MAG: T9SS type A sorting domain-containing protein [Balneolia bacterium]|nr:T9SS type A sorting domain-containing protein [Balneolia bacterium]
MNKALLLCVSLIFLPLMLFGQTAPDQNRSVESLNAALKSAGLLNEQNILRNYDPNEGISLQIVDPEQGEGFVFGTNIYGDQAKGTFFEVEDDIAIESLNLYFGGGTGMGTITVMVVAGNENTGADLSQVFGSVEFNLEDANIPADPEEIEPTSIVFDAPVIVSGEFGIVYSWDPNELEPDAFGLASSPLLESRVATEWEQWDNGGWHNVSDSWAGEYSDGLPIFDSGELGWIQWIDVIFSESVELGEFSLISPPDGAEASVEINGNDPVVIEWGASVNAQSYSWVANVPGEGFDEPLLELQADDSGTATTLSLTTGAVYDALVAAGVEPGTSVTVEWTVVASAGGNTRQADEVWEVTFNVMEPPVSSPPGEIVQEFTLEQNYPNPFNPTTTISFTLPEASPVTLEVFNMQGQRVATLLNTSMGAGLHNVSFDAASLSSGIYLYRLTAGSFSATNKMMLVK